MDKDLLLKECEQALHDLAEFIAELDAVRLDVDQNAWLTMMRNAVRLGHHLDRLIAETEKPF